MTWTIRISRWRARAKSPRTPMMPQPDDDTASRSPPAGVSGRPRSWRRLSGWRMKVLVLGAGVIGVTTAYELAGAGHEVDVVDRQPAPALETSFANAGEVSPGYSAPWAGPGVPLKAIKWLAMHHRPLVIRPHIDRAMHRLGAGDAAQLHRGALRDQQGAHGPARRIQPRLPARPARRHRHSPTTSGCAARCSSFRTQKQFDGSAERHRRPARERRRLRAARPRRLHPPRAGAGAGEREVRRRPAPARRRDRRLLQVHPGARRARAPSAASTFRFGTPIRGLVRSGDRIAGVDTDAGTLDADAYLVALGSYSPLLLGPIGVRIPVYPVKGYSITVPIVDPAGAPESTVMDETHKVAVTRLGDRIRVGGTAELAGYTLKLHEARRKTLAHVVGDLFPARRRHRPGRVLVRPPADDARRHAGDRRRRRSPTSSSPPATARSAGPWPPAPGG